MVKMQIGVTFINYDQQILNDSSERYVNSAVDLIPEQNHFKQSNALQIIKHISPIC